MTTFDRAVDFVLNSEGGFNDDHDDHGGVTKFGISFSFLKELSPEKMRGYGMSCVDEDHLKQLINDMDIETAKKIYLGEFWNEKYDHINSEKVIIHHFDTTVQSGAAQATKILQRSCWDYSANHESLIDDGVLGSKTINLVNFYGDALIPAFRAERAGFYRLLCEKSPSQEKYLKGWLNRVYR